MDDGRPQVTGQDECHDERRPPPPAPRPSADSSLKGVQPAYTERSDIPLDLTSKEWDVNSISAVAAMRMFQDALEMLADATGDVPPTPPISRPTTPSRDSSSRTEEEATIPHIEIGSPVAHPHEAIHHIGSGTEDHIIQHAAIARRFFSKVAPPFSLKEYLTRMHTYCPHSPGVYLAAATYCHRLCVVDYMVPATKRTIHRLALASIRVAAKALEDNKWTQERISKVGGVGLTQLLNLEVSLCFLLDFDLWTDEAKLATGMFLLQQAGKQGIGTRGKLSDFRLRLPLRQRKVLSQAAGSS